MAMPRDPKFGDIIVLTEKSPWPGERAVVIIADGTYVELAVLERWARKYPTGMGFRFLREHYEFAEGVKENAERT